VMQTRHVNGSKSPQARGKSSTSDILGNTARNGSFNRKWAQHYRMLTVLRERFARELVERSETAKEEMPNFSEHMADAATDSYDRDCALAMLSSSQTLLYEIEQALNRIASGTYGVCEATGKPIESERLSAIPWARFSAEAQTELEVNGGMSRPRLGALGTVVVSVQKEDSEDDESEEPAAKPRKAQAA
jgi:RNA polymerase-binding transcription factor DksA